MSNALQFFQSTRQQLRDWSWFKRSLLGFTILTFMVSSFMFLTPVGTEMRIWMANTVIITQHRDWAWIFVGTEQRDSMLQKMRQFIEENAEEKQQFNMVTVPTSAATRKNRTIDELIKVEDVSGTFWKGKRMYVYDPKSIRLMTPAKPGEGEKISSMVKRTGAVAGVNAGGFDDPEGLGNGFAAIGAVISGGEVIYTDQDSSVAQHIVGFTKEGTLVVGKYNMFELQEMGISEAASFYPRVIANGKPLPINDISRAPRTGVGQKADGTVIFIVADGRSTQSVGATLKEIQELFLADDVVNAGFLDGGASSELVVNGELVTKPSSRYGERRLPSAYLVYDHPEDAVANRVWDGLSSINAGGAFDHPDFLREQAELRAKAKNNPAPATTQTPAKTTDTEQTKTSPATTGTNKPSSTNESTKPNTQSDASKPPQGTDNGKTTPPAANNGTKDTGKDTSTHPNTQQGGNGSPVTTDPVKPGETTPTGAGAAGGTTNPATNNPSSTTGGTNQQGQGAHSGTGGTSVPNTNTTPPAGSDASKNTPATNDASKNAPATNDASKNAPAASSDASTKNTPATGDTTPKTNPPVSAPPVSPAAPSGGAAAGGSTETTTVPVK